jgi:hypothetical protein
VIRALAEAETLTEADTLAEAPTCPCP